MVMRNITILFSLLLCIVSCSVHEAGDRGELFYGKRDSVSFSVSYALLPESTKAAEVNETLVEDVNLYLFNELGDLVYYSYSEGSSKVETSVYENMNYSLYANLIFFLFIFIKIIANNSYCVHIYSISNSINKFYT